MPIDPDALDHLRALLLGLAFSGLIAAAFECATGRRLGLALLGERWRGALALLPVLAAAAPFLILRHATRGRRFERGRPGPVMAATILAGLWGLAAGQVLLELAHRLAA